MANFFKKTLNVFVEFEDDGNNNANNPQVKPVKNNTNSGNPGNTVKPVLNQEDIEKFSKHFDKLFDQANLPGPDYFEFCKMMETLEAHIPDEKARMSATFASLAIQGMTKQKLIDSATQYKLIVVKDKTEFDNAVSKKSGNEIESRKKLIEDLEKKIVANSELIQNLTKEISAAQMKIASVKNELMEEQNKLDGHTNGYKIASEAMLNKITTDIQKLQNNL